MTAQPPMQQTENDGSRAEIEALTLRALSAETALKEAKGLLSRFVDEFGCTIERYHKIGPDFTFKDGTQVFDVGVVLDREDLIEEARVLTLKQSDQGQEQGADLSKPTGLSGSHTFQHRVGGWMAQCFRPEISEDRIERCDRFIEEALELIQACGSNPGRAHALVDYVFGRDIGDPPQEVGGVMVTLAALCNTAKLDMADAGEVELARILRPEIIEKIRAKQAAKPTGSALPSPAPLAPDLGGEAVATEVVERVRAFADLIAKAGHGETITFHGLPLQSSDLRALLAARAPGLSGPVQAGQGSGDAG